MENKKLYRSNTNKKLFGVCGGLAEYFNMDATIVRLILVILICCFGVGILPYFICALVMDVKPATEENVSEEKKE